MYSVFFICLGASAGALCRWGLNVALNSLFPAIPPGTLAANWIGALIMGFALAFFASYPMANPQLKLLLITGFLGSLTTFSAFSGEMAALFLEGRFLLCAAGIGLHVLGSIAMVILGMAVFGAMKNFFNA